MCPLAAVINYINDQWGFAHIVSVWKDAHQYDACRKMNEVGDFKKD
jgi:hypothetical protein